MTNSNIQKRQERVLKAQEQLGVALITERETKRKRRDGRLLKLGVLAEQMFLAGDFTLLSRFESAALEQFSGRKVDRLDFEFDETLNWFDKTREETMLAKAQPAAAAAPPKAAAAPAPVAPAAVAATKPTPNQSSRPSVASGSATPASSANA